MTDTPDLRFPHIGEQDFRANVDEQVCLIVRLGPDLSEGIVGIDRKVVGRWDETDAVGLYRVVCKVAAGEHRLIMRSTMHAHLTVTRLEGSAMDSLIGGSDWFAVTTTNQAVDA